MSLTQEKTREIIDDFVAVINEKKQTGPTPTRGVINFRNERSNGIERPIYYIPLELLRYRKDNSRIVSDVLSYERSSLKKLDEKEKETQDVLFNFLYNKDPDNTDVLKKGIKKEGQIEPAIITCDGFLIDGNRRKMALELLNKTEPGQHKFMKVIILPGKNDPTGPPPTIKEIELIENRYQLRKDGRSEYFGLDRALGIKKKIERGIPLDEQIMDDPECAIPNINDKDFKKKKRTWEREYLQPLEQVDAYLESLGRPEHYESIKGRWQSFIDLSNFYNGDLQKQSWRIEVNLDEDDIGVVQDIAFQIIRKQHVKNRHEKLHNIIRRIPKFLSIPDAKSSIYLISDKTVDLESNEKYDSEGKEYSLSEQDKIWSCKKENETIFAQAINKAYSYFETQEETENSMALIKAAHQKINHDNMNVKNIPFDDLKEFMKISELIINRVSDLKDESWERVRAKK
ncbi:MAG: hypothetical protein FWE22_04985 [Firmicutes bacterium]|nr:hypothetical protein [Bacillota bacterium]